MRQALICLTWLNTWAMTGRQRQLQYMQRALQTANLQRSEDPAVALEMSSDGDALERDDVDDDEDLDEEAR
jgi:hypothetical protein